MMPKRAKNAGFLVFAVTSGLLVFLITAGIFKPLTNLVSKILIVPLLSAASRVFESNFNDRVLQSDNIQIKSLLIELDLLKKENDALRFALALGAEETRRVVPVSNVGFYRFFGNEILVIDHGIESGVMAGDPVRTAGKVYVGRVISNDKGRADVLLATSRNQVIDISFPNLNIRARARGMNGREFVVDFVPEDAPLQKGDLFSVTKKAGDASSGLLVGEIREVTSDESRVFKIIRAIHLFNPLSAEPLFVITSGSPGQP